MSYLYGLVSFIWNGYLHVMALWFVLDDLWNKVDDFLFFDCSRSFFFVNRISLYFFRSLKKY